MGGVYGVPRSRGTFDGSSDKAVKVVLIFGTEGQASLKVAKGVLKALKHHPILNCKNPINPTHPSNPLRFCLIKREVEPEVDSPFCAMRGETHLLEKVDCED